MPRRRVNTFRIASAALLLMGVGVAVGCQSAGTTRGSLSAESPRMQADTIAIGAMGSAVLAPRPAPGTFGVEHWVLGAGDALGQEVFAAWFAAGAPRAF